MPYIIKEHDVHLFQQASYLYHNKNNKIFGLSIPIWEKCEQCIKIKNEFEHIVLQK